MKWRLMPATAAIALLALFACNRAPKTENDDSALDRVSQGAPLPPQRVTHGLARLDKLQKMTFEVPPHQISPRLQGSFTSFVQGAGGARVNDESADVELMVMTEDQYDAYTHHRSAESLYAIEPSHDHGVSISLPVTQSEAAHYYAVFRRNNDAKTPVWVNADLSVVFNGSP
jgi:hypothetical protein